MTATDTAFLSLRHLRKSFDGVVAVHDVSFDVAAGEVVGLIGPNGSGKTTLINMITGVCKPTAGNISFCGDNITGRAVHRIARLGIARTFQNIRLFDELSLAENVLVGADRFLDAAYWPTLLGTPAVRASEREGLDAARATLSMVSARLGAESDRRAGHLPYADKRRLEIARALAARPKLLLLDEPAAGMSPSEIRELVEDLKQLARIGMTILLVEHKMRLIEGVTERVIVLDHGVKIADDAFAVVRRDPHVVEAYLGKGYADAAAS